MDPIPDLCQPTPLFLNYHPGCLFKGDRLGYPLAPDVGIGGIGHTHDSSEFGAISEEAKIG
jgi:hypothetical protein